MQTRRLLGAFALVLAAAGAGAETWQGQLQGGGVIQVDPVTHKPTYYYNGGSTPLWDGVHQLDNGSVVIVREGVVVPDENMYHTWTMEEPREAQAEVPLCDRLVRKTCGFDSECFGAKPCDMALQLKKLAQEENGKAPYGQVAGAVQECRKGLADVALFPACDKVADGKSTPCVELVARVCGDRDQCSAAPACDMARQLLAMERDERLHSNDPHAFTGSGKQCREAKENTFFAACAEKTETLEAKEPVGSGQ